MTPEEKAKDIYKTFFKINQQTDVCFGECNDISVCDGTGHGCGRWKLASKEEAIVCVDEIIAAVPCEPHEGYWEILSDRTDDAIEYWQKVKEEIQKL